MAFRGGKWICDGRCPGVGFGEASEANFDRQCAWCGIQIDLCGNCLNFKFTCDRCFSDRKELGVKEARRRAKIRERRREYMSRWRKRGQPFPWDQLELWAS